MACLNRTGKDYARSTGTMFATALWRPLGCGGKDIKVKLIFLNWTLYFCIHIMVACTETNTMNRDYNEYRIAFSYLHSNETRKLTVSKKFLTDPYQNEALHRGILWRTKGSTRKPDSKTKRNLIFPAETLLVSRETTCWCRHAAELIARSCFGVASG